jgi:hypothetical protein
MLSQYLCGTGLGTHSSRSTNTRQKWRDATLLGSYRLRRNQHLYGTEASLATRDITSGGTHHLPRPRWMGDATCTGQLEYADHGSVLGLSRTG